MSKLDQKHLKEVCRIGGGIFTCSYLGMGAEGMECLKGTGFQSIIDQRRTEKSTGAMGDNCSGPPDFKLTQETIH
ncbi:MAG: hypothetical protein A2655_04135 [Candidatus Yanofskybacteria bacterium RIFCSPHIGHO2_01_FULL_43_42]|uniref:Uncharacterized protein n=1 Tax=Candidatus Yanofskybacteria bacterium RIFCSPLOWO2_01_FULL_43_22 TaxID=1802695 RepID=A0A1F8GD53_9BACT|nr:MAG: hypothetical protein A2655_04135 [Candidatus Yanofskybacteria bacterium RIFCSPHIGHO2_01_FULL_43_42]OGN12682.1 MAG: hypothetical protein A3D48_01485 [Candidatus Yanofskybacteria bacterium RIFCSPHIGHO2_02_FULL_43_17]OGN23305.1 MAG: hypothetical protein A3A13_04255 [Candidatus Yanofskybacteria bacterium RIFCSPLOWO2_01_FULL_43_22]